MLISPVPWSERLAGGGRAMTLLRESKHSQASVPRLPRLAVRDLGLRELLDCGVAVLCTLLCTPGCRNTSHPGYLCRQLGNSETRSINLTTMNAVNLLYSYLYVPQ